MKLYLSSYQIGTDPQALLSLVGKNKRVALVLNAADPYGDAKRAFYVNKFEQEFAALGLEAEEVDLRAYYDQPSALREKIQDYGLIWASGGNTFALRSAMQRSGIDTWLGEMLREGGLVYGGFSAGACVCGPTLKGIHLADDPEQARPPIWDGLNLIDFCLVPHYRSNHPESAAMEEVVAYCEAHHAKYVTLHDGEALKIVDGHASKVGTPSNP